MEKKQEALVDLKSGKDSCGIGFVADIHGKKSHGIVQMGLEMLANLEHRGACGCDPLTGDGAGILLQIPDAFFRKQKIKNLPNAGDYAVRFAPFRALPACRLGPCTALGKAVAVASRFCERSLI